MMEHVQKILVPVSFSEQSRVAVEHARRLAEIYHAQVDLLHVLEPKRGVHLKRTPSETSETMEQIARYFGLSDQKGMARVEYGKAAAVILKMSPEYDLIVMGTSPLRTLKKQLLGGLSDLVVRETMCPVMTVNHESRAGRSA